MAYIDGFVIAAPAARRQEVVDYAARFEEAGVVTARLRAYVQGAARAQRLAPLAACAELIGERLRR